MVLTWNRRARILKERKQLKFIEAQQSVLQQKEAAEQKIAQIEAQVKEEVSTAVEARKKETRTKIQIDRAKGKGVAPFGKHVEAYEEAKKVAESANTREIVAKQRLKDAQAQIPSVPEVPPVETMTLTQSEAVSIALFVMVDLFQLNKWVVLAVMGGTVALFALAEHQGWLDLINF
jgi:seryl-tRNA synthetase